MDWNVTHIIVIHFPPSFAFAFFFYSNGETGGIAAVGCISHTLFMLLTTLCCCVCQGLPSVVLVLNYFFLENIKQPHWNYRKERPYYVSNVQDKNSNIWLISQFFKDIPLLCKHLIVLCQILNGGKLWS